MGELMKVNKVNWPWLKRIVWLGVRCVCIVYGDVRNLGRSVCGRPYRESNVLDAAMTVLADRLSMNGRREYDS